MNGDRVEVTFEFTDPSVFSGPVDAAHDLAILKRTATPFVDVVPTRDATQLAVGGCGDVKAVSLLGRGPVDDLGNGIGMLRTAPIDADTCYSDHFTFPLPSGVNVCKGDSGGAFMIAVANRREIAAVGLLSGGYGIDSPEICAEPGNRTEALHFDTNMLNWMNARIGSCSTRQTMDGFTVASCF